MTFHLIGGYESKCAVLTPLKWRGIFATDLNFTLTLFLHIQIKLSEMIVF